MSAHITTSTRSINWFFIASFLLFLVLASYLNYLDRSLITFHAPNGIVSYELSSLDEVIKKEWTEKEVIGVAVRQTLWDFFFIASYALVMWHALKFTQRKIGNGNIYKQWWSVGQWVIIAAVIMDVLENVGILYSLYNDDYFSWLIHVPAYIKWCLILFFVVALIVAVLRWVFTKR